MHRDIKSEIILVELDADSHIRIHLSDFGFATTLAELRSEKNNHVMGTPFYMPIEMISRSNCDPALGADGLNFVYDERVDLWSAGVLLYRMLYGAYPFEVNSPSPNRERELLYAKIKALDFTIPPAYPDAANLIKQILKKPQERISLNDVERHPWLMKTLYYYPPCK